MTLQRTERSNTLPSSNAAIRKRPVLVRTKRLSKTRSEGPTPMLQKMNFILHIKTTNTSPQHGVLLNRFEQPDSVITHISAGPIEQFDRIMNEMIELSVDEKDEPAYIGETLTLESVWQTRDGRIVDSTRRVYNNTKGFFTVAEIVAHIVDFERIDRPKSKWFGGVDCHHVFFEGFRPNLTRDAFCICWGS